MKKSNNPNHTFINPQTGRISITEYFGENLAQLLASKIVMIHKDFDSKGFCRSIKQGIENKSYTQRIEIIADKLKVYLPESYPQALAILMKILGPENKEETGMFTNFYWLMPVGKFIEKFGLDHFKISIKAIEDVTKRNTG